MLKRSIAKQSMIKSNTVGTVSRGNCRNNEIPGSADDMHAYIGIIRRLEQSQ
jgi:hypothetical protein